MVKIIPQERTSERTREQFGAVEVPKISEGERNFAAFTDGEARCALQDVDVDQHAHCDGTLVKKV